MKTHGLLRQHETMLDEEFVRRGEFQLHRRAATQLESPGSVAATLYGEKTTFS